MTIGFFIPFYFCFIKIDNLKNKHNEIEDSRTQEKHFTQCE